MRLHTDINGIADVSVAGLLADLPHFKTEDNLSKFVRSLRRKKYIYYAPRQGRRGSFLVHFGDWALKGGILKQFERLFEQEELRSSDGTSSDVQSEATPNSSSQTPKSNETKPVSFTTDAVNQMRQKLRSQYTNTETRSETKPFDSSTATNKEGKPWRNVPTSSFRGDTDAERRCKQIALILEEPSMNFILSILKQTNGDIEPIEEAFTLFSDTREQMRAKGDKVDSPGALFNSFVQMTLGNWKYEHDIP